MWWGADRQERLRQEDEELVTSGDWRGKNNSLSRGAAAAAAATLSYSPRGVAIDWLRGFMS